MVVVVTVGAACVPEYASLALNLAFMRPQVSSLSLPLAKLVAVYEQLVLELLEMRELDVARYMRRVDPLAVNGCMFAAFLAGHKGPHRFVTHISTGQRH